jgi:hypothetical protein
MVNAMQSSSRNRMSLAFEWTLAILLFAAAARYIVLPWARNYMSDLRELIEYPWESLFPRSHLGQLGMNDGGRKTLCEALRVDCGGRHYDVIILRVNQPQATVPRASAQELLAVTKSNFRELLGKVGGISLRMDEATGRVDAPQPIDSIENAATKLGVVTIGDFWAACGFHTLIIRDEPRQIDLLKASMLIAARGNNPVVIDATPHPIEAVPRPRRVPGGFN